MNVRPIMFSLVLIASTAWSQSVTDVLSHEPASLGEGWQGFTDFAFLANAVLMLTLAAILGATLAHHPEHGQTVDSLDEVDAPSVYTTYSVIGALIGIMVVKYGLVVGFVLFGIGGLIRFRTIMRSARLTGHVIYVTLIGLSCGLDLPHVAVLATAFGYVLICIFNARITYRIDVRGLPAESIIEAAAAYRGVLEQQGCRIMSEKKKPGRERITFIFRSPRRVKRRYLQDLLETKIAAALKGSVDWEID